MSSLSTHDRRIPYYFVAFFLFIALVNGVMVTLAVRTHTGLVTDHPYEKGLAYNNVVAAQQAQDSLGWQGTIELRRVDPFVITFSLRDEKGALLPLSRATAHISRPSQAGMDFDVELEDGNASITFPEKGAWDIRVFATVGDKNYQQSKRIVVE